MAITAPGFYPDIPADEYHADPCVQPSLSSSIAKILLEQSPLHAWHCHPRLGGKQQKQKPSRDMELGTVAHKLLIGRGAEVVVIEAENYTRGDAKQERAEAYEAGCAPILRPDLEIAEAMVAAAREQLSRIPDAADAFNPELGQGEVVMVWKDESGPWCRSMVDWLPNDHLVVWDYKTTGQSAAPQSVGRKIADMGYEIQAGLYERGLTFLDPSVAGRLKFRWLFQETEPPYLIMPVELDAVGMEIGRRKVAAAIHLWDKCLSSGFWPGYPTQVVQAEYPQWSASAWEWRETEDPMLAGVSYGRPGVVIRRPRELMEPC
ncbi:hypothetical protein DC522_05725 [Microvirga sp. KLBC 81]|uniref:PD-(D/E)XK nuclease-like domain-containing protein n=1 Tax=Microvirga sp. KLBC 81 TaxID=1862707 RepID=UPI000D51473B|nr:PD-(D/E)XK nuclease-like domain-containing protein [Microvirga sp. KLBC 81]PVE25396.1 hypothetical protein DC522_05725 [Microvirga sp. KLBC 81]